MSKSLVEVRGVHKSFRTGDHKGRVLQGVDLSVEVQESLALIGPSGSGKSTLLNLIGTLDQPDQGTIVIDGKNLSMMAGDELADFRNRRIGLPRIEIIGLADTWVVQPGDTPPTPGSREELTLAAEWSRALSERMETVWREGVGSAA